MSPARGDGGKIGPELSGSQPPGIAGPFFVTDGYEFLAEAARRMGDLGLAERLFRRALALDERQLPVGHPYPVAAAAGLRMTLEVRQ